MQARRRPKNRAPHFIIIASRFPSTRAGESCRLEIMTITLLTSYLVIVLAGYGLDLLNLRHLKRRGNTVPRGFESAIDAETLQKTTAYTVEKSRLELVESLFDNLLLLLFLFGGLLGAY